MAIAPGQYRRHIAPVDPGPWPFPQVVPGVADRRVVGLHADDRPAGTDRRGQYPGEQARAAVQIQRRVTRLGLQAGQDGGGQRIRRGRMHLPERSRADPPVPARRVLAEVAAAAHGS